MNKRSKIGFGLLAVLAAVGAVFLVVSQASAVSGTLKLSSPTLAPGGQATVDLRANVPSPGLGAWTVDITYDPTKVAIVSCAPAPSHSECNPNFGPSTFRLVGATGQGFVGDISLATVTFRSLAPAGAACTAVPLDVTPTLFADATPGGPQPITVTTTDGSLACAPATVAPAAATATPLPQIASTGSDGGNDGGSSLWLVGGLVGAGLAMAAGYGALQLRKSKA